MTTTETGWRISPVATRSTSVTGRRGFNAPGWSPLLAAAACWDKPCPAAIASGTPRETEQPTCRRTDRGVDAGEIAERLAAPGQPAALEYPEETNALIDHILVRYHETQRRELPELIRLAREVESVHRDHAAAPRGLADELELMSAELEAHMQKEEEVLVPMMRRAGKGQPLGPPVAAMRAEHDDHGTHLHRLDAVTDGFRPPDGACRTWQALYAGAAKLAHDGMADVHLENHVLFPRFE